jgi:hypothetical protein
VGNALPAIDDAPGGAKSAPPVINHKEKKTMANTTTVTGNLTREVEIRYTKEGQATAQLGIAVNRRWQDRSTQEWQEATSFFDVLWISSFGVLPTSLTLRRGRCE